MYSVIQGVPVVADSSIAPEARRKIAMGLIRDWTWEGKTLNKMELIINKNWIHAYIYEKPSIKVFPWKNCATEEVFEMENEVFYVSQSEKILRIVNKMSESLKKSGYFGTDKILYASEIHIIDVIGRNPGINITEIAEKMGIVKSAVPKVIQKLIKKEMVCYCQKRQNKKVVQVELTEQGKTAYHYHLEFHKTLNNDLMEKFKNLTQAEMIFLNEIMSDVENAIDKIRESQDREGRDHNEKK